MSSSDEWIRRVGLYGTHNNKQFEVASTQLLADIDEATDPACRVTVIHSTKVDHSEAVFWFPLSDLRGAKDFYAELNGERLVGSIQLATSPTDVVHHHSGAPYDQDKLYYYVAKNTEALTSLDRGSVVELRVGFKLKLVPVTVTDGKRFPCFMCPISACFPRGVDTAKITAEMKAPIRGITCVDPRDRIYPSITHDTAVVSFDKGGAISPDTDLFIMRIETGPRILHDFDNKSILLFLFVIVAGIVLHYSSVDEVSPEDIFY